MSTYNETMRRQFDRSIQADQERMRRLAQETAPKSIAEKIYGAAPQDSRASRFNAGSKAQRAGRTKP